MGTQSKIGRCIARTRTVAGGALLYRMAWWFTKAKTDDDGALWYARSRAEWLEDTGLSLKQYNKALAELKELGLVETRQRLYGNRNISCFRITEKGLSGDTQVSPQGEHPSVPGVVTPECALSGDTPKEGSKKRECKKGVSGAAVAAPAFPEKDQEGFSGEGVADPVMPVIHGGKDVNAKDFILQAKAKPKAEPKTDVGAVANAWREGMEARNKFCAAFTLKQLGMLKLIFKRAPKGKAIQLVAWAVGQWETAGEAAKEAGAFPIPAEPRVEFLLKYLEPIAQAFESSSSKEKWKPTDEMEAKWAKLGVK